MLGFQIVERARFKVAWNNTGLRLVQVARDHDVWVLDMWKIKGAPNKTPNT